MSVGMDKTKIVYTLEIFFPNRHASCSWVLLLSAAAQGVALDRTAQMMLQSSKRVQLGLHSVIQTLCYGFSFFSAPALDKHHLRLEHQLAAPQHHSGFRALFPQRSRTKSKGKEIIKCASDSTVLHQKEEKSYASC